MKLINQDPKASNKIVPKTYETKALFQRKTNNEIATTIKNNNANEFEDANCKKSTFTEFHPGETSHEDVDDNFSSVNIRARGETPIPRITK